MNDRKLGAQGASREPRRRAVEDYFAFFHLPLELRNQIYALCTRHVVISKMHLSIHDRFPSAELTHHSRPELLSVSKEIKREYEAELHRQQERNLLVVHYFSWSCIGPVPNVVIPVASPIRKTLAHIVNLDLRVADPILPGLESERRATNASTKRLLDLMPKLRKIDLRIHATYMDSFLYNGETFRFSDLLEVSSTDLFGDAHGVIPSRFQLNASVIFSCAMFEPPQFDPAETWAMSCLRVSMLEHPLNRIVLRGRLCDGPYVYQGLQLDILGPEKPELLSRIERDFDEALEHLIEGRLEEWQIERAADAGLIAGLLARGIEG